MINWHKRAVGVAGVFLLAGCCAASHQPADLDVLLANADAANRSVVILIGEFGSGGANQSICDLLNDPTVKQNSAGIELITLDLDISRNRATAARFHIGQSPVLVCLSPKGLIVCRDEGTVTTDLVIIRISELKPHAADLDNRFTALQNAVDKNGLDLQAQMKLADFMLAQQNDREAIPHLAVAAASDLVDPSVRIRAWVEMARAHLWIAEPEKARHEAKDLIASLGPNAPDAIAGGNLVLGMQDAKAKRFALARHEFETAMSAAPNSTYAKQAASELAQLP
jgi:hypothetical protein